MISADVLAMGPAAGGGRREPRRIPAEPGAAGPSGSGRSGAQPSRARRGGGGDGPISTGSSRHRPGTGPAPPGPASPRSPQSAPQHGPAGRSPGWRNEPDPKANGGATCNLGFDPPSSAGARAGVGEAGGSSGTGASLASPPQLQVCISFRTAPEPSSPQTALPGEWLEECL